jgi:putative MFS transporter
MNDEVHDDEDRSYEETESPARDYSRRELALVFFACALGWAHDAVGLTLTTFLSTSIMSTFSVDEGMLGFVLSAQYMATVPGAIVFGELADRYGRRSLLLFSVFWDAILTAATAFAPDFTWFALLRILSGMGVSWGIAFALLGEVYAPNRRAFFGGLTHATFIFGYIISAVTSIIIEPLYGWRACYFIALFPIPLVLILYFTLPESKLWQKLNEIEVEEEGVSIGTGLREVFAKGYGKLLVLCVVLFWSAELAYHAIVDWGPTFLELELGFAETDARTLVLLISLVAMLILPFFGFLGDKIGRKNSFVISAIIGLIGTILLGIFANFMSPPQADLAVMALFIIPIGFGSHALFGVWSSEMFPTESRAAATSVIFSLARGLAIGAWVVGLIAIAEGLSYGMVLLGVIGFLLMIFLPSTLPETKGTEMDFHSSAESASMVSEDV